MPSDGTSSGGLSTESRLNSLGITTLSKLDMMSHNVSVRDSELLADSITGVAGSSTSDIASSLRLPLSSLGKEACRSPMIGYSWPN